MTVHVVGNLCLDRSFRLSRLPRAGETLNAAESREGTGGKGGNQAVAAARTGAAVRLFAAVGRDATGEALARAVAAEGVALSLSRLDRPTDLSVILVDAAGENLIVTAAACAATFDPLADTDLAHRLAPGDVLLMQGNLSPAATAACLAAARAAGAATVLNPSPLCAEAPPIAGLSLVIANRLEAEAVTGRGEPAAAAAALRAMGAAAAVVTLGAEGAILAAGHDPPLRRPAPLADAVDTAGAGDCFAGTLVGLIAGGADLAAAVDRAIAAAAIAVGRPGTLAAFPSRAEVADLLAAGPTQGPPT